MSEVHAAARDKVCQYKLNLPSEMHAQIRERANANDRSISAEIIRIIRLALGNPKAAAQLDYEARIRSALASPSQSGKPSADELRHACALSGRHEHDGCACSDDELALRAAQSGAKTVEADLRQAVIELARAGSHLREFVRDHSEESTCDIEASLYMVGRIVGKYTNEHPEVLAATRAAMEDASAAFDAMVDRACRSRYSAFDDWNEELRAEERYRIRAALTAALGGVND